MLGEPFKKIEWKYRYVYFSRTFIRMHQLYNVLVKIQLAEEMARHYNDIIRASKHLSSTTYRLLIQQFVQAGIIGNIKDPHHWPSLRESTGDRWIPLRKGRQCVTSINHVDFLFLGVAYLIWGNKWYCTVKHVYNDHLMGYFSAFWSPSRWPVAT